MKTKSKSISEILRQEIVSGKFDAEGRLPLEAMLSAELVVRESSTPGRRARKGKRK